MNQCKVFFCIKYFLKIVNKCLNCKTNVLFLIALWMIGAILIYFFFLNHGGKLRWLYL